ncbi:hypothetical protein MUDAN_BIHEEGNE_03534 [Lactiplantibacillus mudanjiangensis]|nr:hypothetical protein MUDAN_BIHEEGNE_03534 [Lactiplantibacillus mudanjiangensis]
MIKKTLPLMMAGKVKTNPFRTETRYLLFPTLAIGGIKVF